MTAQTVGQCARTASITRHASSGSPKLVRSPVRIATSAVRSAGAEPLDGAERHVDVAEADEAHVAVLAGTSAARNAARRRGRSGARASAAW